MGQYLNPSANSFARCLEQGDYVDKSGLISYINGVLGSLKNLVCSSRPRRFGKSLACQMLVAYYSKGCDSRGLFKDLEISQAPSFDKYLNNCDVLSLDILGFLNNAGEKDLVEFIEQEIYSELLQEFPEFTNEPFATPAQLLLKISLKTGRRFVFIIDEWDAIFRERKSDLELQQRYIKFLISLFKGNMVGDFVLGAYMTGILPIKKYGTQSALTDFNEVTMLDPYDLAKYIGFTEDEVAGLCRRYGMDLSQMRHWYDGYLLGDFGHVFCPSSVMKAISKKRFGNYWAQSETYDSLKQYIELNFDGLKDAIISLLAGNTLEINPRFFKNDLTSMDNKDDVLTLLVHLGYLGYNDASRCVFIPNEELRQQFADTIKSSSRSEILKAIGMSDEVLKSTVDGDATKLAELIQKVHNEQGSIRFYNNEQALRAVIRTAYFTASDCYDRYEELEGGKGYADMVFIPKSNSDIPALIVELKWNRPPKEAIAQIREQDYPAVLKKFSYQGPVSLIGISYDPQTKKHECAIETTRI